MLQATPCKLMGILLPGGDSTVYTIGYKSLDEADEKIAADHEAVGGAGPGSLQDQGRASKGWRPADPSIREICTHLDVQRQHIVITVAARVEGAPPREAIRAEPVGGDGPGGFAGRARKHMQKTGAQRGAAPGEC
jgi:hypothetical protein